MALLLLAATLTLLPLVAAATYTPWPLPVATLLVSSAAGGCAMVVGDDLFLGACTFLGLASALFTLTTGGDVLARVTASRDRRPAALRRRERRPRRPMPVADTPWRVAVDRERDAA